jgi:hypothetical protein
MAIHASMFQEHIKNFPSINSSDLPPDHTVIIEADIRKASGRRPKKNSRNNNFGDKYVRPAMVGPGLRKKIYAQCGEQDLKDQQKMIDPALKLYVGCHCMINDNDNIRLGQANGTLCKVIAIKRKENASLSIRSYDSKKVYALNANDLEYVLFEYLPKTTKQFKLEAELSKCKNELSSDPDNQSLKQALMIAESNYIEYKKTRQFKLTPKKYYCTYDTSCVGALPDTGVRSGKGSVKWPSKSKILKKVILFQLPVNLNDATTAHKLQGSSKKQVIVNNWTYTHGWVYTVLSRVRTLNGLFLVTKLLFDEKHKRSFELPLELLWFENRMKSKIPDKAL